jgi:hypothetical protein
MEFVDTKRRIINLYAAFCEHIGIISFLFALDSFCNRTQECIFDFYLQGKGVQPECFLHLGIDCKTPIHT